jgi:hypothetical protein
MPSTLPPETGGDFELPPEGNHLAVCYRVIDLGTQKNEYQGEVSYKRTVMIVWELPHEPMKDGRPFSVSRFYNWSMNQKATLRHDLEAWRGKPFNPDTDFGPSGFNPAKLLGKGCMIQVMHNSSNGKTYANIKAVAALPKGTVAPAPKNEELFFDLDARPFDEIGFGKLSPRLQTKVMTSPEYQEAVNGAPPAGNTSSDLDDEIPF